MIARTIRRITRVAAIAALTATAALAAEPTSLKDHAKVALGVRDVQLVEVSLVADQAGNLSAVLDLSGVPVLAHLSPHSVRAGSFQVLAQQDDGSWQPVAPDAPATYRGELVASPGSAIAGSVLADGLHARIRLADGHDYWLQPLSDLLGLGPSTYALYDNEDVLDHGLTCGTDTLELVPSWPTPGPVGGPSYAQAIQTAELACDADYEYFLDYGSTGAVVNRIESVINTMNLQYESEVEITHAITTVLVRTSASQPYTSTDAVTLLNQFRNEWNANQGGVARDVAQLFTGKEIDGGTIGIAWVGVVCNLSYAYGVVQSDFNNNLSCATDLSAHELGHGWNASHCNCTSNTMNPYITCANTFHPTFTIPTISSFRDSRSCLDGGGGPCTPSVLSVTGLVVDTANQGRGSKVSQATVTVTDDCGNAVAGVTVTVQISGDLNETLSGVTGANGSATMTGNSAAKGRVRITGCVTSASGSLAWDGSTPCDSN